MDKIRLARAVAESFLVPVPSKMASSSVLESLPAPISFIFSRGRSIRGNSLIRVMFPPMVCLFIGQNPLRRATDAVIRIPRRGRNTRGISRRRA
jgi:hypothetical protein